jgi:voltage-gated potassium channel
VVVTTDTAEAPMHTASDGSTPQPSAVRRQAARSVLRSLLVATAAFVAYFTVPMQVTSDLGPLIRLVVGLVVVTVLLTWQVLAIVRSPFPRARAVGALAVSVPLFLLVFATTYYLMAQAAPAAWNEPLSRLDALYFTVTVFATVGFGDIAAVSAPARAVVTVQMAGGLILVGLIARVVVGAMQEGVRRRAEEGRGAP